MTLRPLAARSVVLSLLLGMHPPELPVRSLVKAAEEFGIAETTLRVALTRMVSAGDLTRDDGVYRLSDRLLERQRRQDALLNPKVVHWRGQWEMVVVTAVGRAAADRAELRSRLTASRLAELREGVWLRPANLKRSADSGLGGADLDKVVTRFQVKPDVDPTRLAATLWDLPAWAASGRALLQSLGSGTDRHRLVVAAAIVRHLVTDPVLPDELLPSGWPGQKLRDAYAGYQAELLERGYRSPDGVA